MSRHTANRSLPGPPPRWGRPGVVLLVIMALGLGIAALVDGGDDGSATTLGEADPGVVHVHGLGLNPTDGELFAATHTGLFALRRGAAAVRVADRYQDTMAFTVIGPDRFLGSGHPDVQEAGIIPAGGRPLLGLIESVDAGRAWRPLSLTGFADFHSLVEAHGRVYGLDSTSGRLMVGTDRTTWDERAELAALDIAVSPDDAEVIVATDASALLASTDGGRSFARREGPNLAFVEWPTAKSLLAMSSTGDLQVSADAGTTWSTRANLEGEPEAFLATGDQMFVSIVGRGIMRSTDGGQRWELFYRNGGTVTKP